MLITEKIKVKWNPANADWYKSKGYVFTKWKDEFEVKVEDLSEGNRYLVDVQCDECGKLLKPMRWQHYKRYVHKNSSYYCKKCAAKLYGTENLKKSLFKKNGKSFYDWCIEHNRQDILDRWDYELNSCSPKDILYSTHEKYWFKCYQRIHKSELKDIHNFTNGNEGVMNCKACNSIGQYLIDLYGKDALNKYWDWKRNEVLGLYPFTIAKNSNKKVWIKCQEKDYHESYDVACNNFINNDRCPYCNGRKVHKYDSLGHLYPEVILIWSEKNKKSPFEYSTMSSKKIYWKCKDGKHKDYYRSVYNSQLCEFRCPECMQERIESILQEKTRLYLENNFNYPILHEQYCSLKPKNIIQPPNNSNKKRGKGTLRYDNEIIINNIHLFIEVMGSQHRIANNYFNIKPTEIYKTMPEEELKYLQDRDKYKEQYVYDQGDNYHYLAIWDYDFNKKNTYKKLIDDKINEILNNIYKENNKLHKAS